MVDPQRAGEIVKRALAYPFQAPPRSFLQLGTRTLPLPEQGPDLAGRTPLLAYGANAAPQALAAKLAALPELALPVLRAGLAGFDVVFSAHVSFHGAIPATLLPSPGTTAPIFVAFPTPEQLRLLSATEPNYELTRLDGLACPLDAADLPDDFAAPPLERADAYVSRHGTLRLEGEPVALAAVEVSGRTLAEMTEPQALELARRRLAPDLTLEDFVLRCAERGGLAPLPEFDPR